MITKPKVTINKLNYGALNTCAYLSSESQTFSNLSRLKNYEETNQEFETLSLNDFELDGEYSDNFNKVAFMSKNLSNVNGVFENTFVEIIFSKKETMSNITLDFGKEYPKKISIDAYKNDTVVVTEIVDYISSKILYSTISFTEVDKIRVTYLESHTPYRYAYLQNFLPGSLFEVSGDRISNLSINETTDLISSKLEIDTAHLEVFKRANEFNILDLNNMVKTFKKWDSAEIEVEIEDNGIKRQVYLGKYYIDKIEVTQDECLSLDFVSLLGMLDNVEYIYSGIALDATEPLENINAKRIIDSIFECFADSVGISRSEITEYYEIEEGIDQIRTYGYLPKMSCREALQNVCFVNLLKVLDNRSKKIRIEKSGQYENLKEIKDDQIIKVEKVLTNASTKLNEQIKNVTGEYNNIELSEEEEIILEIESDGTYIFDNPYKITSVTGGTGASYSYNINFIRVKYDEGVTPFKLTVRGNKYNVESQKLLIESKYIEGKAINISNSKLLTYYNAEEFYSDILDYYNTLTLELNYEYINTTQETGYLSLANFYGKQFVGYIIHQSIDVSGGMVASCQMLGVDWTSYI